MERTINDQDLVAEIELFINNEENLDNWDAQALGLILNIPKLSGDNYADWECLELIRDVVNHWKKING